jgi:hypothetical protein
VVKAQRFEIGSLAQLDQLLQAGQPFVLSHSVDKNVRESLWSPSGLRSLVGTREVSVTQSDSGTFDYTDGGQPLYSEVVLPFPDAIQLIASSEGRAPFYYLRRSLLAELGLGNPETLPSVFQLAGRTNRSERLWVSSQGSVTPLHYDTRNNLLAQMHGSKEVILFSSSEHERMYPQKFTGTNLLSQVDPEAVDHNRFPNFPWESKITVELNPGDTLYIPPLWWHQVRSLEFSISVNVFWQMRHEQCLVPNSIEYLRVMYKRNAMADLFKPEEPNALCFANLAARAHEVGLNGAAILFCAASARMILQSMSPAVGAVTAIDRRVKSDGIEKLTGGERARLEHVILLGALAASQGQTPKSSALDQMLADVFRRVTSEAV